jgi:hypothetical protein
MLATSLFSSELPAYSPWAGVFFAFPSFSPKIVQNKACASAQGGGIMNSDQKPLIEEKTMKYEIQLIEAYEAAR